MKSLIRLIVPGLLASLAGAAPLRGDNAVLYWNDQALHAVRLARNPPPIASAFYASYHVAIFDAINGITRTHHGWLVNEPAPVGIDTDAAIAGAAHTMLLAQWGQSTNPRTLHAAYERFIAGIPDGPAKEGGLAWGRKVAEAILKKREQSGYNTPIPGTYSSQDPGKWRETPPGFRPPVLPFWRKVTPFAMTSPEQFRCPPPPDIGSRQFADELAHVARVGARDGAERTEYETLAAAFWSDDLGTATPPGHWNMIAQDLARQRNLTVLETARLFALLNIAGADSAISCWDTKFYYSTWRPETAVREITPEINPHATAVPDFIPLMVTPAFPSYVSGHSTFSAAASRVCELFFGTDEIEFSVTSEGLPGAVRTYRRLSDCRDEIGMSRVWGGIHYMSDNIAGQESGLKVADWVFATQLQPRGGGEALASNPTQPAACP